VTATSAERTEQDPGRALLAERLRETLAAKQHLLPLALLVAALLWAWWRTGLGLLPNIDKHEFIAQSWPTPQIADRDGYILRSPIGLVLYQLSPFRGVLVFAALHAAALLGAYAAFAGWFLRHLGWHRGLIATTLLVLSPLTAVVMRWVGSYDAFYLLAWAAVLWTLRARWPAQLAAGLVLGVQNAEQGIVGLLLFWLLRGFVTRGEPYARPIAALAGAVLGKLLLEGYLHSAGAVSGSRATWLANWALLEPTLSSALMMLPVIAWSGLCGLWFFVPQLPRVTWTRPVVLRLLAAAGLWLGTAIQAADHSRLLSLTLLPVVLLGIREVVATRFSSLESLWRSYAWWVLVIAPPTIVWVETIIPHG
jgi:hypothetical protein